MTSLQVTIISCDSGLDEKIPFSKKKKKSIVVASDAKAIKTENVKIDFKA